MKSTLLSAIQTHAASPYGDMPFGQTDQRVAGRRKGLSVAQQIPDKVMENLSDTESRCFDSDSDSASSGSSSSGSSSSGSSSSGSSSSDSAYFPPRKVMHRRIKHWRPSEKVIDSLPLTVDKLFKMTFSDLRDMLKRRDMTEQQFSECRVLKKREANRLSAQRSRECKAMCQREIETDIQMLKQRKTELEEQLRYRSVRANFWEKKFYDLRGIFPSAIPDSSSCSESIEAVTSDSESSSSSEQSFVN